MTVSADLVATIRALSRPLDPIPTGVRPDLPALTDIKAVVFDVYGTMFVSGSGDIGVTSELDGSEAMAAALKAVGIDDVDGTLGPRASGLLIKCIRDDHARKHRGGHRSPEVEIRAIWKQVLAELAGAGVPVEDLSGDDLEMLAVEYECRINPVWPMPGLSGVLSSLSSHGLMLGIVSNAQFYTKLLFHALLNSSPEALGFASDLCVWSYEVGEAKPSPVLFKRLADTLRTRYGLEAGQCLYVGNDMLNDISTAAQVGCHTALFAGDLRSLRMREDDPRCSGARPSVTVTRLDEILGVLTPLGGDI